VTLTAEGIVGKVLGRLDIVLVLVGPVEEHSLTVVGDGVARLPAGIAPLAEEIALVIVPRKEGIEIVEYLGLGLRGDGCGGPGFLQRSLRFDILHAQRGRLKSWFQVPFRVKGLLAKRGADLCAQVLAPRPELLSVGRAILLEGLVDGVQQVVLDEALDAVLALPEDAIDAEIEISIVELEKVAKVPLQARAMIYFHSHGEGAPSSLVGWLIVIMPLFRCARQAPAGAQTPLYHK